MDSPINAGEIIDGKYLIESMLGEGGMGVVFRARHLELDQAVALKVLRAEAGDVWQRRFMREARAASRIGSEHVVRVFDVGWHCSGLPYMVMELLEGRDLADVVEHDGPLDVEDAVHHVLEACEALAAAHARGIVHRDVKPGNLFLARRQDGTTLIKLLDFGISKESLAASNKPDSLTRTNALLGSPLFMSPEQLACSRDVDHRADIWSLAVSLFELLTGEPAFAGDSVAELYSAILRDRPRRLGEYRPDLPPELETVILQCLEKDPADRLDSVLELAEALRPFAPEHAEDMIERVRELSRPPIACEPFSILDDDTTWFEDEPLPLSGRSTLLLDEDALERIQHDDQTPGPSVRPVAHSIGASTERRRPIAMAGALAFGMALGMTLALAAGLRERARLLGAASPQVVLTQHATMHTSLADSPAASAAASPFADSALLSDADQHRLRALLQDAEGELARGSLDQSAERAEAVLRELLDRGVRPNEAVSALGAEAQRRLGQVEAMKLMSLLLEPRTRREAEELDGRLDRQLARARKAYEAVRVWGVRSLYRCALSDMAKLDLAAGRTFMDAAGGVETEQRKWFADRAKKHLRHARTGFVHSAEVLAETELCVDDARAGHKSANSALELAAELHPHASEPTASAAKLDPAGVTGRRPLPKKQPTASPAGSGRAPSRPAVAPRPSAVSRRPSAGRR